MTTVAQALERAATALTESHDSARLDAEVLLCHTLGRGRSFLYAWPDHELEPQQMEAFFALVERRADGEPVAHLTGTREFWSLELKVTRDTLIPRPETELLVELALERIDSDTPVRVADLGTGSGAIALAIASERPHAHIIAADRSAAALAVAQENAGRLALPNVEFREGAWFAPLDGRFAVVVSNPPYVAERDPHLERGDVRHEPRTALTAGPEGLNDLQSIVSEAPGFLEPGGWLLLEHGFEQGTGVRALFRRHGFEAVATHRDYAGLDRVTVGRVGS